MNLDKGDGYVLYRRHHSGPHGIRSEGNSGATHQSRPHSLNGSMPPQSVKNRWPACHQPTGGGCQVRLNNMAKYVELTVEGLRTRVRFPPPPPMRKDQPLIRLVFFTYPRVPARVHADSFGLPFSAFRHVLLTILSLLAIILWCLYPSFRSKSACWYFYSSLIQ